MTPYEQRTWWKWKGKTPSRANPEVTVAHSDAQIYQSRQTCSQKCLFRFEKLIGSLALT